jgi:hypothetical protein
MALYTESVLDKGVLKLDKESIMYAHNLKELCNGIFEMTATEIDGINCTLDGRFCSSKSFDSMDYLFSKFMMRVTSEETSDLALTIVMTTVVNNLIRDGYIEPGYTGKDLHKSFLEKINNASKLEGDKL